MINPDVYYTVQGWMISELGLKGNALAMYAIIYGFSMDGMSEYAGSSKYLCEWLGCSKKTALTTLADLVERGLLVKRVSISNGVKLCNYMAVRKPLEAEGLPGEEITPGAVKNLHQGGEEITPGAVKNLHQGGEEITPHNYLDNYLDNYKDNNNIYPEKNNSDDAPPAPPTPPKEEKKKRGRPKKGEAPPKYRHGKFNNVLLTEEELRKLQELYPDSWQERIDDLSFGLETKGYKYKNHYAVILSWDRTDKKRAKQNTQAGNTGGRHRGPNGIAIDQSKNDLDGVFAG